MKDADDQTVKILCDDHLSEEHTVSIEGMAAIESVFGPEETMNRFEKEVRARGMTVFAHIDHAAGAASARMALRPTELLIFGNIKAGTSLIEAAQTIAIDLPLRALVWQDEGGSTWLAYNLPSWLLERHGQHPHLVSTIASMTAGLQQMAAAATGT